ncbi:MAG: hypothetical protein FJ214_08815 [Ignavibacteria bacterium]|nr:hypothetical protein [Ignavibacteria bacterium]
MKKLKNISFILAVVALSLLFIQTTSNAQSIGDRLKGLGIDIPFIDKDGDGINDLLQNGWGLRFLNRWQHRQDLWDLLNVEIIKGENGLMVDTDGDGVGDIAFRDFIKSKMDELIDTNGDGTPDTPLKDLLGRRFKGFDRDGDGLPDRLNHDEMKELMQQMKDWRDQMRERIKQGLPPFIDANGDGIPDNLPEGFKMRGWMKGKK